MKGKDNDVNTDEVRYSKLIKVYGIDVNILIQNIGCISEIPQLMGGIMQFCSGGNELPSDFILSEMQDVNCWTRKINHLIYGINKSVIDAINVTQEESYKYFPFSKNDMDQECYYHIENAEFRLIALWDILAQLFTLYFRLPGKVAKVKYKEVFDKKNIKKINVDKRYKTGDNNAINHLLQNQFSIICEYIREEIRYDEETAKCFGNHKYLSEDRNSFTHRNNPHEFTILNSENKMPSLPDAPLHIIKRLVEDYMFAYDNLYRILKVYWIFFEHLGFKVEGNKKDNLNK